MAYQQTLEKESDGRRHMVGLSVNETIRQCLILGWGKKADKIKNEWKVPEKRFAFALVYRYRLFIDRLVQVLVCQAESFDGSARLGRSRSDGEEQEEPYRV